MILRYQVFWDTALLCVEAWLEDNFQAKDGVQLLSRQVVNGREALKFIDEETIPYIYARKKFPGLCLIGFNRALAEAFAAKRLNENQDNLADISNIFLGLICESAGSALWESLAFKLLGQNLEAPQPSTTDFGIASGGFEKTCRYLVMTYSLQLPGGGKEIQVIFTLESVRELLQKAQLADAQGSGMGEAGHLGLHETFMSSSIEIQAVLDNLELTLGDCIRLEPGQVFELPNVTGRKVHLSVDTMNGHFNIAAGQVGAWRQKRAVKLTTPIAQDFASGLGATDFAPATGQSS